ncbi:protein with hydrophobic anchor [Listeria floridensis FSL S10-1187]|uniref:Protein with hydrophobic anchor n=1 Tax=Listeria floridensis FSL S10-1187 TaxID=1265817 RepID=A0ABN0RBR3_9LIST|nr:hypothetical protein [Listeria floridensis]EUJ25736.1 protein with hydrophobic anchor [Listeria floridensis FSL S10-1187]
MRKWLLRFLLIMLLALSGCATVTNTVKVGLDGKTDLSFDLKLAKLAGLFTGQVDEQVKEKLEQQGFSVEEKSKTHYLVKKTVKSSGKKSISKAKLKKYGVSVKETKGLFVNRYRIDAELDVPKLIQEHVSEGVSIPTGLFSQIDYTLVLDLPVKPAKSNADNIHGGKTHMGCAARC